MFIFYTKNFTEIGNKILGQKKSFLQKNLTHSTFKKNISLFSKIKTKKSCKNFNLFCTLNTQDNFSGENQNEEFLTEDKGVIKKLIKKGKGEKPSNRSTVKVHYTGKLENGQVFDSSIDRKDPYIFEIDQGKVIKGWEIGIKQMQQGEKSSFIIGPKYGYKKKGIPPIIPPNAKLFFEIELLEIIETNSGNNVYSKNLSGDTPRTPEKIAEEFEKKISMKNNFEEKKKFENFFFISPFQSQSGEKAPWWLNPNITFIFVFLAVFLIFYLVVSVGGIHQGYVE